MADFDRAVPFTVDGAIAGEAEAEVAVDVGADADADADVARVGG